MISIALLFALLFLTLNMLTKRIDQYFNIERRLKYKCTKG